MIEERLSELSDTLGIRYCQVCKDLRDQSRLAWTSDAHELRDILANVLRTLAPTEEVEAQKWYKLERDANGPTQAQRVKFILLQNQPANVSKASAKEAAKNAEDEIEHIDVLVSKIVRSTYKTGSRLAHSNATHRDCVGLLLHFDALMFSLLNAMDDLED
jgi:recombinational DNA repair protein RecR